MTKALTSVILNKFYLSYFIILLFDFFFILQCIKWQEEKIGLIEGVLEIEKNHGLKKDLVTKEIRVLVN